MRRHARFLRRYSALLLVAGASAAMPLARWCPIDWDQIDTAAFLFCASDASLAVQDCARVREIVASGATSCGDESECAASAACPLRGASECPSAAAATTRAPGEETPAHHARGRAYCLDDPGAARAKRSDVSLLQTPLMQAALVASIATAPAPRPPVPPPATSEARPPTRPHAVRPPVRGPPTFLV